MSASLLNPFELVSAAPSSSSALTLPGTSGNYVTVADSSDLDIVSDLTLMIDGALTDWTPAASNALFGKYGAAGHRSFRLFVNGTGATNGFLALGISTNGTALVGPAISSVAPTVVDGAFLCVGVTWRASDGRTQFWTAPSGTTTVPGGVGWTQLGTNVTLAAASIFASDTDLQVGAATSLSVLNGKLKRARVWASIDGSDQRLDANFTGVTIAGTRNPTTLVDAAKGATVTVNGTGWDWAP